MKDTLLIGVGSDFRSDDMVGILIARRLSELMRPGLEVVEHHGEGSGLMELWEGYRRVIVVDAAQSGTAPTGTLHDFDVIAAPLPAKFLHYSSHLFGLAEAIELARTLTGLPEKFHVFAIEGENFSHGGQMTKSVNEAMERLIKKLEADLT